MAFIKRILLLSLLLVTGLGLSASDRAAEVSFGDRWGAKASLAWTSKSGLLGAVAGDDFVATFKKNPKVVDGRSQLNETTPEIRRNLAILKDGANWVIAVIKKEGTGIFPPSRTITRFEVTSTLGSQRRYDVVVSQAGQPKNFFEFKSYKSVPPDNFKTQFINDLNNPDITNLSQLKWIFDAAKKPPDFVDNMKAAIEGLDLSNFPISFFNKFGVAANVALKAKIKSQFTSIFSLE